MKINWIKRAEWTVAILLSFTVLFLLIVRATHAGALWRDECGALQLARVPNLIDVVNNFQHEAFPPPFPITIRLYTDLFGTSDQSLRCFGLAVGITFICVAWFNSRVISSDVPLLFLALMGLNTTFLAWGTTVRGYGLGCVLISLAFGLTAKLLLQPKRGRVVATCLVCLASAQFLLFNIALVAAIAAGAIAAFLLRRRMNWALAVLGIVALCAISYIPYLQTYLGIDWNTIVKERLSLARVWQGLNYACGKPTIIMSVMWHAVFLVSFVGAIWRLIIIRRRRPFPESDLLLFGLVASVAATSTYYVFFRVLSYQPAVWYYVALLCLSAATIDLIMATLCRLPWTRFLRLGFVIAALLTIPLAVWPKIIKRQTNIDLIAHELQKDASANDLIVVNPWTVGVSFNWYYHGHTRWLTVPVINEHRTHRYDLLKAKMMEPFPLDDLEHEVSATLRSGNRVWLVGNIIEMPYLYQHAWSQQLGAFISQHALQEVIVLRPGLAVNEQENLPLWTANGWRD